MSVHETTATEINIDSIVRQRAGRKSKYIPRFVTRWLAHFIHQDFINTYLRQGREGVDFCRGTVEYLGVELTVEGRENLPPKGEWCTFVSNHPLGAIDGVALGWVIGDAYDGHIKYLANDLLMNLRGLAPLCVPINKIGKQKRDFAQKVEEAFGGEHHIIMFPAGICSRMMDNGEIADLEWHKGFINKSVKYRRNVVPIHFIGYNSPRFYRVARWCKRLHLPNFAMALLPNEMHRSQNEKYTVKIGKPIPWQTFDQSRTPAQWAQWVRAKVYKI